MFCCEPVSGLTVFVVIAFFVYIERKSVLAWLSRHKKFFINSLIGFLFCLCLGFFKEEITLVFDFLYSGWFLLLFPIGILLIVLGAIFEKNEKRDNP